MFPLGVAAAGERTGKREKIIVLLLMLWMCAVGTKPNKPGATGAEVTEPGEVMNSSEEECLEFLEKYDEELLQLTNEYMLASWAYMTNLTEHNKNVTLSLDTESSRFSAEAFKNASRFNPANFTEDTKRKLSFVGGKTLSEDKMANLSNILAQMGDIYGSTKLCRPKKPDECFFLEPGLTDIMAQSTDYEQRLWAWQAWRDEVGKKMKPLYIQYVELKNELARLNGYCDYGEMWRDHYDSSDFRAEVARLYEEIKPLYLHTHAYIRRRLYDVYGASVIDLAGPLPAHLLSDMWGRFWNNLYRLAEPYPGKPSVDPSPEMSQQGYTPLKMFQTGNAFYTSMGLKPVPHTFWNRSMLEKPADREVICHATAWDFYDGKDFRIKMCTRAGNFEDLLTIHHELGHTQYHMQYAHLPAVYRDGANNGFHEAVGELMAMVAATPKHLHKLGLITVLETDEELDINFLLSQALFSVTTVPFHLAMDQWRWRIFQGDVPAEDWNAIYWKIKEDVVGVKAPVERSPSHLDGATLYHVNQDFDMIRYFVRTIIQYQFAKTLCDAAGHVGPLHKCDFSSSQAAGDKLAAMLQLGRSKPWQDAMEVLTGHREMSAQAILDYYEPLLRWLENKNLENGDGIGWGENFTLLTRHMSSGESSVPLLQSRHSTSEFIKNSETDAKKFLKNYDKEFSEIQNKYSLAAWDYNTNLTDENNSKMLKIGLQVSEKSAEAFSVASAFDTTNFSADMKRQLKMVGSKSLPPEEVKNLSSIISEMGNIYGSTKLCMKEDRAKCLQLEPGLTELMATSTDYEKRLWAWQEWRNQVGKKIRPLYIQYVELKNKLAQANNHSDYGEWWRSKYESETFEKDVHDLYEEVRPLYEQIHAYIRRKLYNVYGPKYIDLQGPLPANVLSDMWGRFWNNLYNISEPYKGKPAVDPSPQMAAQGYDYLKMFRTGNSFYTSMGLFPVPESFWKLSLLTKPADREVICHPTAWDFSDGKDYRIKMCTVDANFEDLLIIHHELGHIQYFMQYKHQPVVYRDGANDGFHEAIGELMAMVAATPEHLHQIGLIPNLEPDEELDINFLLSISLFSVSTLPFHLVMDQWRWDIFRGSVPVDQWNQAFWKMKEKIVGVKPPVPRDPNDLDPPTLFHVCQDYDMIRYFTRTIMQFQFARALCDAAGHTGPLYKCDFSGSTAAGDKLAAMLQMGASRPWQDAMEKITGHRHMSVQPLLDYFEPLYKWLKKKNKENGDKIGWIKNVKKQRNSGSSSQITWFILVLSTVLSLLGTP